MEKGRKVFKDNELRIGESKQEQTMVFTGSKKHERYGQF